MARKKATLRLRGYTVVRDAVEEGAKLGYVHAYKYTKQPKFDTVVEEIVQAIMVSVGEVVDWEATG